MLQGARDLDDPTFGAIRLSGHGATWVAEGPAIGRFELDGLGDATLTTPLGSAPVHDGPGFARRRSSDRRTTIAGRDYHLHHRSPRKAQLRRDGLVVGRFRRHFRLPFTKGPAMVQAYEVTGWAPTADATDAGVGHVLVACHGAGAEGFLLKAVTLFA